MPSNPIAFTKLMPSEYEKLDFYQRLGLDPNDENIEEAVKSAYRARARLYHPDKNPSEKDKAEAIFKALTAAHETLSDAKLRQSYNLTNKKPTQEEKKSDYTKPSSRESWKESKYDYQDNSTYSTPRSTVWNDIWNDLRWQRLDAADKNAALKLLDILKQERIFSLTERECVNLRISNILHLITENILTVADARKLSPELKDSICRLKLNHLLNLKSLPKEHSWRTFSEEGKKALLLPGVLYYRIETQASTYTTHYSYHGRHVSQDQIDFIKSLSPTQIKFLHREEMRDYITTYERFKLAFKLTPEIMTKIPQTWWEFHGGVIDLIANGYDVENFNLAEQHLNIFELSYYRALLDRLTLKELIEIPQTILPCYSFYANFISREKLFEMLRTTPERQIINLFQNRALLQLLATNVLSIAQLNQIDHATLLLWANIPACLKGYLSDLNEHEPCSEAVFKFYMAFELYMAAHYKLISEDILAIQTYWTNVGFPQIFEEGREKFYQHILFKNYFRLSDQQIDLSKAKDFKPEFSRLGELQCDDLVFRLRKELINAILKTILETEWIANLQESKVIAPIGKTLPPKVETLFNTLKEASELPSTSLAVTSLLTKAKMDSQKMGEEKLHPTMAKLHEYILLIESINDHIEKYRKKTQQQALEAKNTITTAKLKKAGDACFILACACYCPLQYILTFLNCCGGSVNHINFTELGSDGWQHTQTGSYGPPIEGKGCIRFFCAPKTNMHHSLKNYKQQNEIIALQAPIAQRMI